jgi:hypothetical protein
MELPSYISKHIHLICIIDTSCEQTPLLSLLTIGTSRTGHHSKYASQIILRLTVLAAYMSRYVASTATLFLSCWPNPTSNSRVKSSSAFSAYAGVPGLRQATAWMRQLKYSYWLVLKLKYSNFACIAFSILTVLASNCDFERLFSELNNLLKPSP